MRNDGTSTASRESDQPRVLGGRARRHLRLGLLCARLKAKLAGYSHVDGVPGQFASLTPFVSQALGILKTWRNRRSHRRRDNWAGYTELLAHFPIDRPRIVGRPKTRMATSKV